MAKIEDYEFTAKGFKGLKTEIQALAELVGYMAEELTPEQRASVAAKQKKRYLSQEAFEAAMPVSDALADERAIRIARTLK